MERGGELDPIGHRHRAVFAEGIHVGFGKGGEFWQGDVGWEGRKIRGSKISRGWIINIPPPNFPTYFLIVVQVTW